MTTHTPGAVVAWERLKELLNYDPETGLFTWRQDRNNQVRAGSVVGSKNKAGYITVWIDGKSYRAHRLAVLWMTGEWPPDLVDHIDGSRDNNRWSNLRSATKSQNNVNSAKVLGKTCPFKGVRLNRRLGQWETSISINNKTKYLGVYKTPEEAAAVYQAALAKQYGEYAKW